MADAAAPVWRVTCHERVASTNDLARAAAVAGAAAGTVIVARCQTAGRGRRGRPWESPTGNLHASVVLRPDIPARRAHETGFRVALAVAEGLMGAGAGALRLKWPNDVLDRGRKVAGILVEGELDRDRVAWQVAGIGANLAAAPPPGTTRWPAGDLGGLEVEGALGAILAGLESWLRADFATVRTAWVARAYGRDGLRFRRDRAEITGRVVDLDADGCLVLEGAEGRRRVCDGEIMA